MTRRLMTMVPAALLTLACDSRPIEPPNPVSEPGLTLRLDSSEATVILGDSVSLTATMTDASGHPVVRPLRWFVGQAGPVTVSSRGVVSGHELGDAMVYVSDGMSLVDSARIGVRVQLRSVHAGGWGTCALTPAGRPVCWGWNDFGGVGNADRNTDALLPTLVAGAHTFTSLSSGGGMTCGLTGEGLYCWGFNGGGQLGDGTSIPRPSPVRVADSLRLVRLFIDYGSTTCGLELSGQLFCWGWNRFNQLLDGSGYNWRRPVIMPVNYNHIASGSGHMCGLDANGAAFCWGRNDWGQLGDGSVISEAHPVPVSGGLVFSQLVAGRDHTCGRTSSGSVYCWGRNDLGQLGSGSTDRLTAPALVGGGMSFDTVVTSFDHTCGLASRKAYCWGWNNSGQAGRGETSTFVRTIEPAVGNLEFVNISAGVQHTCAMTANGTAWCWGHNQYGALGIGSRWDSPAPMRVLYQLE